MAHAGGLKADLPPAPLLVALSGGADSAVAALLAQEHPHSVRAAFVDHELGGSARLRRAAQAISDRLGLDLLVVAAPVEVGPNQEERAREARYAALRDIAGPTELIVTGHTLDDQAETVLANLLRGAGTSGLTGIAPARAGVVRPLLHLTRAQTRRIAAEADLQYADDPDNDDRRFLRNRIRLDLLPSLERQFNPNLREVLARSAEVLVEEDRLLHRLTGDWIQANRGEVVKVPAPVLQTLPPALAARVVRAALRAAAPPHPGTATDVDQVLEVGGGRRAGATLSGAVQVQRAGAMLEFAVSPGPPAAVPQEFEPPGRVTFAEWEIVGAVTDSPPRPLPLGGRMLIMDADRVGPILLRPALPGDRIEIRDGSKPVSHVFGEASVPVRLRNRWPVFETAAGIAAVPGLRAAWWARPTPETTRYLLALTTRSGP